MDALFTSLSSVLGAPPDQIKLIFCFLVAYPLSSIYVKIPKNQPQIKHAFNIGASLFFLIPLLRLYWGTVHVLVSTMFTYIVAARVQSERMPWIVFGFVMSHLLINHAYRTWYLSLDDIEITGTQMVLVMKLSTFAWNVYDGRRSKEVLDPSQLATRVTEYPGLLEFLGYAFYFPGFLIGPAFEFNSYRALIDESIFTATAPPQINGPKTDNASNTKVPSGRNRAAYTKLLQGLVFLLLFSLFGPKFTHAQTLEPQWAAKPFWYRLLNIQIVGFFARTKYYGAWLLTDGATILTGLGFNGYTALGKPRWDKAANLHITNIEFAPNFKVLLDNWNINTNVWLRNCIYKRVTPKGTRPGFRSSMLTFLTSALWHGFYGGYYLTFVLGGFIQTVARQCRTYLRPLFTPPLLSPPPPKGQKPAKTALPPPPPTLPKRIYDVLGVVSTQLILNYATAPFCLLTVSASFKCWKNLGWYGHIMVLVPLVFFMSPGKNVLVRMATHRQDRARLLAQGTPELIVLPPTPASEKFSDAPDVVPPVYEILDQAKKKV
ncbi:endoplasmic reticulum membrane protein [Ceratobasidium sp. AG-Ba]|nr:endoplasmic reticulum membrane protein [Ceratobasidium sp. AG-Ba]